MASLLSTAAEPLNFVTGTLSLLSFLDCCCIVAYQLLLLCGCGLQICTLYDWCHFMPSLRLLVPQQTTTISRWWWTDGVALPTTHPPKRMLLLLLLPRMGWDGFHLWVALGRAPPPVSFNLAECVWLLPMRCAQQDDEDITGLRPGIAPMRCGQPTPRFS